MIEGDEQAEVLLPSWLCKALEVERTGDLDDALDIVFEALDTRLKNHRFNEIDDFLSGLPVRSLSTDMLLTFLTVTLAAKERLPSRHQAFTRIRDELEARDELEEDLIDGLAQGVEGGT